jgi:arginase family enzyme
VSERAHAEGKRVLGLGGDHLVCLPLIRGAARGRGALQVLQLDAHTDYQPVDAHEVASHANFVHFLAAEPLVSRITVVGVRGYSRDLYPLPEKHRAVALEQVAETLLPGVPVYLTVDTDAFDPSIAPGVGHPQLHGLGWDAIGHALAAIERAGCELVGADWTEYNPEYDTRNHLTALGIVESLIAITGALARHHARASELAKVA